MNDNLSLEPEQVTPTTMEAFQRAEIDLQIATAKRYPRELGVVKQKMISFATLDIETAESCFYSLPRGGKNIQGPSVRLAEIAVSCYKNLRVGSRVISTVTTGENPHVVIQAVCHDLENNVAVTMEKRRRITKKKFKEAIDEDDINLACNAGSAIAFRDAVFKIVPGALIKPVYDEAKKAAIGDVKTLGDRRARMLEAFSKMGVTKEMVFAKLDKKTIDDVDLMDLGTLIGLHTALKDGDLSIDEAFPAKTEKVAFAPANATPTHVEKAVAPKAEVKQEVKQEQPKETKPQAIAPMPPTPTPEPEPDPSPAPTTQPEPPPEPRKVKPKPAGKEGPKDRLIAAGVTFDDFTDWCVTTGRQPKAKDWPDYDNVPSSFWSALGLDDTGVAKCITIFGQQPATTEAPAS